MRQSLLRSYRFAQAAQQQQEQMVMMDTRTFCILVAMAALWAEDR